MARAPLATALALVALAIVVGANSVTRLRQFTPDSMVYVDVARNLNAGRGLAYRALELNDPVVPIRRTLPVPLTTFPPLYPLAIAGLVRLGAPLGLEAAEAALALAALGWLAVLLLGAALARRAYGGTAALLALAALLVDAPFHAAGTTAWSETLGVALVLGSLLALPPVRWPGAVGAAAGGRAGAAERPAAARAALAGLLGGLAFATRYALAPVLVLGPMALLVDPRPWRRGLVEAVAWAGAALVPVALVLARNQYFDGELMPSAGPSHVPWVVNLGAALRVLFGRWAGESAWPAQALALVVLLALALVATWRRERSPAALVPDDALPLAGWVLAYLLFLVVESSLRAFDPIDARLVLPASVAGALVTAGMVARGLRVRPAVAALVLVAAFAFAAVREARVLGGEPPRTTREEIAASPRLAWLARHTGPRDLLIGDDAIDLSFWLHRDALSLSSWPGAVPLTPERLRAWCLPHRTTYDRMWIVLSDRWPHTRDWGRRLGPFFARLATGRDTMDAGVTPAAVLPDAIVYCYQPVALPRAQ